MPASNYEESGAGSFERRLTSGITVTSTRPQHAAELEALQELVFPELAASERFQRGNYLRHLEIFPQGQLVALHGDRVVGMTSTLRLARETAFADHRFADVIGDGDFRTHDPAGDWLYGADIGVHPDYRGRGIARGLYAARHALVRELELEGQVTVGMLNGYAQVRGTRTIDEYYEDVVAGRAIDPTVSAQVHIGFAASGLVQGYLDDPTCGNAGVRLTILAERGISASWERQ